MRIHWIPDPIRQMSRISKIRWIFLKKEIHHRYSKAIYQSSMMRRQAECCIHYKMMPIGRCNPHSRGCRLVINPSGTLLFDDRKMNELITKGREELIALHVVPFVARLSHTTSTWENVVETRQLVEIQKAKLHSVHYDGWGRQAGRQGCYQL